MKKYQFIVTNAFIFFLLFLLLIFLYEEFNLVGYFGFTDIAILALAPNFLYLLLTFHFKQLKRYIKLSLLMGNLLMSLTTLVGFVIWFSGWD